MYACQRGRQEGLSALWSATGNQKSVKQAPLGLCVIPTIESFTSLTGKLSFYLSDRETIILFL